MTQPDTAIIILNWNGSALLRRYLPSVVANAPQRARVIVADNGSTDDSASVLAREFPSVEVMAFDTNYGFAGGYNRAIDLASDYKYVVLLNSDVETPEGWLSPQLDYLDSHPDCAASQPKILADTDRSRFEYAGAAGGFIDRLGFPYCRGRILDTTEEDLGQYDGAPADITWASGAALTVRRDVYLNAGGLDEQFFAHMEEIDLCLRILAMGYRIVCVPGARVFHLGGGSLPKGNPRKVYLNFRNNLLLLHKNVPRDRRGPLLFVRRLADTAAAGVYLLKGDWRSARAVWQAHRDFRRMRRSYTSEPRADVLANQPAPRRMVVSDYYLKRIKTY